MKTITLFLLAFALTACNAHHDPFFVSETSYLGAPSAPAPYAQAASLGYVWSVECDEPEPGCVYDFTLTGWVHNPLDEGRFFDVRCLIRSGTSLVADDTRFGVFVDAHRSLEFRFLFDYEAEVSTDTFFHGWLCSLE